MGAARMSAKRPMPTGGAACLYVDQDHDPWGAGESGVLLLLPKFVLTPLLQRLEGHQGLNA